MTGFLTRFASGLARLRRGPWEMLATILIALVVGFIAWKLLVGLVKFGALALIAVAAIYFLSQGGFA